jgi:DNA integrity scanning protein DisA with diadenylate cyclase activity
MNAIPHADIFFLVSTIGFIIIFILLAAVLIYLIRLLNSVARISKKIEKDIDNIGDTAKNFIMQLSDSTIFSWIFGTKSHSDIIKTYQ